MKNGSESVVHGSAAVSEQERVEFHSKFTVLSRLRLASAYERRGAALSLISALWQETLSAALASFAVPVPARIQTKTRHVQYKE